MAKKTVEDIQVAGKRVLCRVDFNVPLTEDMKVADDKRIVAAMPTIQYLLDHQAKVILCSHLGRPKGKVDMKYTLAPVAARLQELLPQVRVQFASDTVGESAKKCVADMKDGEIVLLEEATSEPAISMAYETAIPFPVLRSRLANSTLNAHILINGNKAIVILKSIPHLSVSLPQP